MKKYNDITMDIQRLRNLTTGRLHTKMEDIYADLGTITGMGNLMAFMLPRAARAVEPWLREHVTDSRFWNGEYDIEHVGEITLPGPTDKDRELMLERKPQPNSLKGKKGRKLLNAIEGRNYEKI